MTYLNCNVYMLVSLYDVPKEGVLYCHVSCTECQSEFLCCFVCDLQVHLQNRTFVRFGRSPSSYMRQLDAAAAFGFIPLPGFGST